MLGESLWSPSARNFDAGLNSSLAYEVYAGHYAEDQLFWIASEGRQSHWHHAECTALDVQGRCHEMFCHTSLPVLCTQSAPASNATYADTAARFQVAQPAGRQTLIGYRDFYTFRFMGVRFAEEPERFTYSSPFANASGVHEALNPAPECLQQPNNGSTDCLFLNVWTTTLPGPETRKQSLKPVMVYIYGGGFSTGSASNPTNDGGNQAARGDVVVVDLAYRLGTLGFLAFNDGVHNGNYWISGLISGLEWMQKYISAFGGDPSKVMIFGESAGAESVQALLASPKAIGLFRAALMQSNYHHPYVPIPQAVNQTTDVILQKTGCNTSSDPVACLQAYNATALIDLNPSFNYPVIDGTYLTTSYINLNASAAGKTTSSVPVLFSVNRDEGGVLAPLFDTTNLTMGLLDLAGSQGLPTSVVQDLLPYFPLGNGPTLNDTAVNKVFNTTTRVYTDISFHCSNEYTAVAAASTGIWPAIYYGEFNRTYQDTGYNMNGVCLPVPTASHPFGFPQEEEYFKCHAGDLANTFGNVARVGFPERDQYDIPFGQLMVDFWTSFARTLDPNPDIGYLKARGYWNTINQINFSGPWKQVNASDPQMMELQWNSRMLPFSDPAQCRVLGQPLGYLLP